MSSIERNPEAFADAEYDLVVAGGGIYGCCAALEAARRGLDVLLLERDDFGGATSRQWLRIIHGGLRYLQHADWRRSRESIAEQAWWLQTFPDLVQPRSCLLPLYGDGWHRPTVMRFALATYDSLARAVRRSAGYQTSVPESGRLLGVADTLTRTPDLEPRGLRGGALWYDAQVVSPPRLLIELLRWATHCGARSLNYMSLEGTRTTDEHLEVRAQCQLSGKRFHYRTRHLTLCGGPWAQELDRRCQLTRMSPQATAMNLLVDRTLSGKDALAVRARRAEANTYFLLPFGDRTLIGTEHLPDLGSEATGDAQVDSFLEHVNEAFPYLRLSSGDVRDVLVGRLPARRSGSRWPSRHPQIVHTPAGNRRSLITSVTGVKFTTARAVAQRTLQGIIRHEGRTLPPPNDVPRPETGIPVLAAAEVTKDRLAARDLQLWFHQESVQHIDDFLLRRTDTLGLSTEQRIAIAQHILQTLGWDAPRRDAECQRLRPTADVPPTQHVDF